MMKPLISAFKVASLVLLPSLCASSAEESILEWQRFPSHRPAKGAVVFAGLSYIVRPRGPRQDRRGAGALVDRCAGLNATLSAAGGLKLKFGIPVTQGKYNLQIFRTQNRLPESPLSRQSDAGAIRSPGVRTQAMDEGEADWSGCRLRFGEGAKYLEVTLSRLTPAVLLETNAGQLGLFSGIEHRPEGIPFAASDGRNVTVGNLGSGRERLPDLSRGWLLLFWGKVKPIEREIAWRGKMSFPRHRHPVLMVFSEGPAVAGGKDGITLSFAGRPARTVLVPLSGLDFPKGEETERWLTGLPRDVRARCDWWAARISRFPRAVTESYAYDAGADRVTVTESVEFVNVREGGTVCAPVPPMVALAAASGGAVELPAGLAKPGYRTAHGPYWVVEGRDRYDWSMTGLSKYVFASEKVGPSTAESRPLEEELAAEVDKMLEEEFLAPWVYETRRFGPMGEVYWRVPSETAYFLARLMPVLDEGRRERVRAYLKSFQGRFPFLATPSLATFNGPRRERYNPGRDPHHARIGAPAEVTFAAVRGLADCYEATGERPGPEVWDQATALLVNSLHGVDWATGGWCLELAPEIPPEARSMGMDLELPTKIANRQLGSLVGILRLAKMCGRERSPGARLAWGQLARMLTHRLALAKYARWIAPPDGPAPFGPDWGPRDGRDQVRCMNQFEVNLKDDTQDWRKSVYVAFLDLTPETGRFLSDYARAEASAFLDAVDRAWPQWYLANMSSEIGGDSSAGLVQPVNSYSLFTARAWIMRESGEGLRDRLDVSWTERGDFFHMHKLAETIKACRSLDRNE